MNNSLIIKKVLISLSDILLELDITDEESLPDTVLITSSDDEEFL